MIIHRYVPYDENDEPVDINQIMAMLGDLMLQHSLGVDEALEKLIQSGQVPNLFFKNSGADDFLKEALQNLEKRKDKILSKYNIEKNLLELEQELRNIQKNPPDLKKKDSTFRNIFKKFEKKKPEIYDPETLYDALWSDRVNDSDRKKIRTAIHKMELLNEVKKAQSLFRFYGKHAIPPETLQETLRELSRIEEMILSIKEAIASGSTANLSANRIREFLGEEKFLEFLELQRSIVEKLKKLLEQAGFVQTESESEDQLKITPRAIEYISGRAVSEIFQYLQSDDSGTTLAAGEGQSERELSKTRPFEFGDNFYHIDWINTTLNAVIKNKQINLRDMEVHESAGYAKNAIIILLDMSGSMFRFGRFYFAKKMILSLDRLIKTEYPLDRLEIVGFGSLAKRYSINELISLQPFPVLYRDPYLRLKYNLLNTDTSDEMTFPMYFTNLQRGLALSRKLLSSKETKNKQIFLITDGVPTGHTEGETLYLNYPPDQKDFDAAIKEAIRCNNDQIIVNTFLLSGEWWEDFGGGQKFAARFVKASGGRFYQSHPHELGVLVMYDFIRGKKQQIRWGESSGSGQPVL